MNTFKDKTLFRTKIKIKPIHERLNDLVNKYKKDFNFENIDKKYIKIYII